MIQLKATVKIYLTVYSSATVRKFRTVCQEGKRMVSRELDYYNLPQLYCLVLKKRLKEEATQTVTLCNGLKMLAPDGEMRLRHYHQNMVR